MPLRIVVLPALLALAACDNGTQGAGLTAEDAAAKGDLAANGSVAPTPAPEASDATPGEAPAEERGAR